MFSPHTRGCSQTFDPFLEELFVFPAYAGMFPVMGWPSIVTPGFPRIRGDVPTVNFAGLLGVAFSPHTRGCSYSTPTVGKTPGVFPAYAGMFLRRRKDHRCHLGFPRIRGDVPSFFGTDGRRYKFSPHTRGCSGHVIEVPGVGSVFPAYAGMFRSTAQLGAASPCFPRIRGDVPMRM